MSTGENRAIVESWMTALATADLELFWGLHAEDVVYNMSGHTVISGQMKGKAGMMTDIVPYVFRGLDPERSRFASKWKIMCDDGTRVVTIMEADCHATNGERYDQR